MARMFYLDFTIFLNVLYFSIVKDLIILMLPDFAINMYTSSYLFIFAYIAIGI